MHIAFNGANYHGWQIQPNASSVQETIEKALSTILGTPITLVGAGRTDTGVHAKEMTAHLDLKKTVQDVNKLIYQLNSFLPKSIAIHQLKEVPADMHARFSASSRIYEYGVCTKKNPFYEDFFTRVPENLDFELMNKAAGELFNYTDFTSFSKLHTDTNNNHCTILHAQWTQLSPTQWIFRIQANRFLRNMVRAIVGTLLEVGKHKINLEDFKHIIEQKDRCKAGTSAPAKSLIFVKATY